MKITPKIDEIAESIDRFINVDKAPVGLTIHYSTTERKWWCSYGRRPSSKWRCYGSTAEEALQNLANKMNTPAGE